jgi:glycosyltransferase involved in cell wall biosynthesis
LLALYNGAPYLPEQLDSIATQNHTNWGLLVSDDTSVDAGPDMVRNFAAQHIANRIHMIAGPTAGASANFMHLLRQSDRQAHQLAFCDQDDVWLPHKLERASTALAEISSDQPALYCSRTLVCDAALRSQHLSRAPRRALSFRNALVQNVVAGNTLVLNGAGARLAQEAAAKTSNVAVHDWWLYQIITGTGGTVIFDDEPGVLYRQHGGNTIGAHHGIQASLSRIVQLLGGRFRRWNDANVAALTVITSHLTPEHRQVLDDFSRDRCGPLPHRLRALKRSGVYRQSKLGNVALWLSAVLRQI